MALRKSRSPKAWKRQIINDFVKKLNEEQKAPELEGQMSIEDIAHSDGRQNPQ